MSIVWHAVAGGFIGTLMLSTIVRAASELGWTRLDLAFLLGTTVSINRRRAHAIGYALQFLFGIVFALAYGAFFDIIGRSSWTIGALLGALHAVFASTVLVNIVVPVVHPRMGTPETAANQIALIEPPGFLMLNYGRNTFLITLISHIVYGAIVGLLART